MPKYKILFPMLLVLGLHLHGNSQGTLKKEGATTYIDVSVVVGGKKVGETTIGIRGSNTKIDFQAEQIQYALAKLVDKDTVRLIGNQASSGGVLSSEILAQFGIETVFNGPMRELTLRRGIRKPAPDFKEAAASKRANTHSQPISKSEVVSGPWASSPIPALPKASILTDTAVKPDPGPRLAPKSPQDSLASQPIGWEPVAKPNDSAPKVVLSVPPVKSEVKLQTYQLDRTRDELFEDVFNHKPPPLPANVEVTLLVDGKKFGTLWLNYSKKLERYTFPADPVLRALEGLVKRELWEKLAIRANTRNWFTIEDLIECGFPTVLNTSVFELSTGVPAQLLGTRIHPISGIVTDPYSVPVIEPSALSGYINARVKQRLPYYQYNQSPFDSNQSGERQVRSRNNQPRPPSTTSLDGAINLKNWVLEGRSTLWETQSRGAFKISRQEIRLVHEWPKQALRFSAGDLIFPTTGFQRFLNMGGLGFSRDLALQPHLAAYPVKDFEFFLPNSAEVKVFINKTLKGTYQMEQGTHDLMGFPFTTGESEVEIQIMDNTGQTQTLNFQFIHEPNLLAKGKSAFSFNVGFPGQDVYNNGLKPRPTSKTELLNYEYDSEHPILFLDYRLGVNNTLTLEGYSQALDTAGIVGIQSLQAFKIGKIKADVAGSYQENADFSWAGNFEYTYIPRVTPSSSPRTWRVRAEYLGDTFYRPGQDPGLFGSLTIGGMYLQNSQFASLNIGASYTIRQDSADFYNAYFGLSKNWGKGWSSALSLQNNFNRLRKTSTEVSATLNYYFTLDKQSLNASERIENHQPDGTDRGTPPSWDMSTDLNWDYNGSAPFPNNPALSASTNFGPQSNDYSGRAEWKGNQGIVEVLGRRYEPKTFSIISNYLDLNLKTALVFASGNLAFSRPINNSFVLVKGIQNEKACDILVNPNEMGYDAKSSEWLPGVVSNVSPYNLKKIHVEVLNPPFGSNDDRSDYTIYPYYKTGYAITMGTAATVIALGTIMLPNSEPVEYSVFNAIELDDPSKNIATGFTNGAGKFQLTRLRPGRYLVQVEIEKIKYSTYMKLPKDSEGIISVGNLVLKPDESAK